jgi:glycosyltransferase involved in cell wall biosynthesis
MTKPKVSFIVPCYKLAEFLPACLDSILAQSHANLEVLVMDDCSPDHTREVVMTYGDDRVRHVRNDTNLGHLRNYNSGIGLSRGEYVWLISADDYLRSPILLQKYVHLLDTQPRVGYVFCPGYGVRDGVETRLLGQPQAWGNRDRVFSGHALLKRLLRGNFVLTPSGMVRRECYEKVSLFPLDMPWCGDWYLWCMFALYYDVGYCAEPMVCYREQHPLSMTDKLTRKALDSCAAEEIRVPWEVRERALQLGKFRIAKECLIAAAHAYARLTAGRRFCSRLADINIDWIEVSLRERCIGERERAFVRAWTHACIGNECYWRGDLPAARHFYLLALTSQVWMPSVAAKTMLMSLGKPGNYLRKSILSHH